MPKLTKAQWEATLREAAEELKALTSEDTEGFLNGQSPAKPITAPLPEHFEPDAAEIEEQGPFKAICLADSHKRGRVLSPPEAPMDVAREILPRYTHDGQLIIHYWRDAWVLWTGTSWREVHKQEVLDGLFHTTEHAVYKTDKGPTRWHPTRTKLESLMDALKACVGLPEDVDPGSWLDPGTRLPGLLISCGNGIVQIDPATGSRALHPHTPAFFTFTALPFDYDPDVPPPAALHGFLESVFPEDPAAADLVQEWFGYVLSGDTQRQKLAVLVGAKRSGKGTLARLLTSLIGKRNMAGPTLATLTSNFGLSSLLGKSLAVIPDARMPRQGAEAIAERLLAISGEDTITVDRKYRDPWQGALPVRFMLLSNELPEIPDTAGALPSRMLILHMRNSFYGREDRHLDGKLRAELPGIFNWSLDGLDRLRTQHDFTAPASSGEARETMRSLSSPMSVFLEERCSVGAGLSVSRGDLFDVWKMWCEDTGRKESGTREVFGRNLLAAQPMVVTRQRRVMGKPVWHYVGVALGTGKAPQLPQG